jgi:hypothetical protein
VIHFTDDAAPGRYRALGREERRMRMAEGRKRSKKTKDLDPKARGKKVRGGNADQDRKNIAKAENDILSPVRNSGPTITSTVSKLVK